MADARGARAACIATYTLLALGGGFSLAETRAAPVYVAIHENIGVRTPATSVVDPLNGPSVATGVGTVVFNAVAAIANRSVNKQSAVKVARYNDAIASLDFAAEAGRVFGCVGQEDCDGTAAFTDPELFQAAIDRNPEHRGVVVELTPELISAQLMIRAVAREFDVVDGKIVTRRTLTAAYTARSPLATSSNVGKQPPDIEKYWSQGDPSHIVVETRRAFMELSRMLSLLGAELGNTGAWPAKWSELPKVKTLYDSGRVKCSGIAWCAVTHVFEDAGDHVVLVEKNGAAMGWFNAKAAATETNLPALILLGLTGR